jgi:hypothetical protein
MPTVTRAEGAGSGILSPSPRATCQGSAADYAVVRASKVPRHVIESFATYRAHVNGSVLFARPEIMGHPDATDLTAVLPQCSGQRKAQSSAIKAGRKDVPVRAGTSATMRHTRKPKRI